MRVGIIQSNYLPWRGYFDFIDDVDVFIVYDDVQFSKGGWRNRNQIKTPQGLRWMTVPVRHRRLAQLICETEVDYSRNWQRDHLNLIATHLKPAEFLSDALNLLEAAFETRHATISELNVALIRRVCRYLKIHTPLRSSAEFELQGAGTERLIQLLTAIGAATYVSGPSAKAYLDESRFCEAGIRLEYKSYVYPEYPQLWGPFEGAVSVIDLIANCGPAARHFIKSGTANEVIAA